jgi:hypothetical protein
MLCKLLEICQTLTYTFQQTLLTSIALLMTSRLSISSQLIKFLYGWGLQRNRMTQVILALKIR